MDTHLLDTALKMPPKERVEFAELILASIDYEEDEIKNAWISEVKNRIKSAEEGKAKMLSFDRKYSED